jgi:hypothetical protein
MSRLALALAFAVNLAVGLATPGRAAAEPSTALSIAGKLPLEEMLVIERVAPDGKATEMFRGGAPTAWGWLDAHTLLELFDQASKGDAVLAAIVDGKPDPRRAITVENKTWPAEAQAWSQYLAVHQGQIWLVREPAASGKPPKGKAKAKTEADKPVYQRVDVTPHVVQREPPAGGVAARDEGRAWLDTLPSVTPPTLVKVTQTKAKVGKLTLGAVQCKPDKGATTTFPNKTTHPFLRINVDAVRFVSPTLPLYIASGMTTERPDGPVFDTTAFLGCTEEPLHTLVWGGGDIFLSIAGAAGGAGFSADDKRKMQLWVNGRAVADLAVLLSPVVAPATAPRTP